MKYLLLIYGNEEKWASIPEDNLGEKIAKQDAWNSRYRATGELLAAYGLGGESEASLVWNKDGAPFTTDGPYLESKEFVCSLYLLDVESAERAARSPRTCRGPVSTRSRCGRSCMTGSRRSPMAAPDSRGLEGLLRSSGPRSSARWSGATGSSTPVRTRCRRRCSPPRRSGRTRVSRTTRGAG